MRVGRAVAWLSRRRGTLVPLAMLTALFVTYIVTSRWDMPAPPPPTSTPRPAPTPTPEPLRIAYPTAAPTAVPSVAPTPIAELGEAGQLLYPGSMGAATGIVAINADGSGGRLLAAGPYTGAAWAPDGRHFVAYGGADGVAAADLFTAEGRFVRRSTLEGKEALVAYWAPDARHVALLVQPASRSRASGQQGSSTWLIGEDGGRELALGTQTIVGTAAYGGVWSADGRLALTVVNDREGDGQLTGADPEELWTVDAAGGDRRKLAEGAYLFLGWSRDGASLYVAGGPQLDERGRAVAGPTGVLAIDRHTGARRMVATIDDVVRQLPLPPHPEGSAPTLGAFGHIALAPSGDRFALWLFPEAADGQMDPAGTPYLAILDDGGRLVWQMRAPERTIPLFTTWAPDGARLAYSYQERDGALRGGIRTVAIGAAANPPDPVPLPHPDIAGAAGASLRWSPDSRWLVFNRVGTLEIVAGAAPARSWSLGTSRGWAEWRPAAGP